MRKEPSLTSSALKADMSDSGCDKRDICLRIQFVNVRARSKIRNTDVWMVS